MKYKTWSMMVIIAMVISLLGSVIHPQPVQAAANLSVEIIAAPNLVVDSNVLSPSTYSPKVGTVIGKICNVGDAPASNVTAYIGDYTGSGTLKGTPGIYPSKTDPGIFSGTYAFTHLGGSADAARFLGTLAPGECRYQFWSFEYPLLAKAKSDGSTIPAWGTSVKPDDDLSLDFDIWAQDASGTLVDWATHTMTMRNEISAMANKIKPNGNPGGQWFNTDTSTVYPGEVITTNGILYRLGNINQGFDNDGDGVPDYNAWLQPFGNPAYDPSCFRLIGVTGVLTVTRSGGKPDLIIPIDNTLYFTNLPPDNTDVVGEVYYKFLALGGACTIPISPYQEVASGRDNEKFNGDYGTGIPALMTYAPQVVVEKNGPASAAENTTITYQIPFRNESTTSTAGLTLSSGGVYAPLTIEDRVPAGLQYVGGSATMSLNFAGSYTLFFSTDSGKTWSTTDPGNVTSTAPDNLVVIRWALDQPLPKKPGSGSNTSSGVASFQAKIPSGFIAGGGTPFVENCAQGQFGDADPFTEACTTTMVNGTASIGDRVWADVNGDANQTGESSLPNVTVYLYWDKNGDGVLDASDVLVQTAVTDSASANYTFNNLPAGKYLVKVDTSDPDLPTGYSPTTADVYAVTLSNGQTYTAADFGFGPTLKVDKFLLSPEPAVTDGTVTFRIDLINTRPGDGTPNGYCVYDVWAGSATTLASPKNFADPAYAVGAPDLLYAVGDFATGSNKTLTGSGYASGGRTSGISKVEILVNAYFDQKLTDDTLKLTPSGIAGTWSQTFSTAELNALAPGEAHKGMLVAEIPVANAPGGSWDWNDLAGLSITLEANKVGGADSSSIYIDALGFRVTTTDTSCATGDSTIQGLPFTDTYDATRLAFVSADPMPTTVSAGTLTWANLGPLYAGGTRSITVTFKALATTASTINTGSVSGATFSSGRAVNDASDTASVGIAAGGSISGRVFADNHAPGTWQSGTGYSSGDTFIPGVEVALWACVNSEGQPIYPASASNKPCTDSSNGGTWQKLSTLLTDGDGAYSFTGLRQGYYNVIVNTATLPPNFTTNSVETTPAANGAGGAGGDGQWNSPSANLNTFNAIDTAGEAITVVSFGYKDGGATPNQGAVVGYVWHDQDSDGTWDGSELPIANVTVELCSDAACTSVLQTVTTDSNGRYAFGNVTPGSVYVRVTQPNGMSQTADPDGTLDHKTGPVTVVANGVANAGNFGYTGGFTLGDTVFVDWDGDGAQDAGEPGLENVTVYLYRDTSGNGTLDSGEPLLQTATTGSNGFYQFTNLPGNGADYIVKINTSSLPGGYTLTADPVGALDHQAAYELTAASVDTADFGYQPRGFGSIGDTIWADSNGNGVQESGEEGISDVLVKLYVWNDDGDGVYESGELGPFVAETTTSGTGGYLFSNLPAGKFIVSVDGSNFTSGQPLAGLTVSGDPDGTRDSLHPLTLTAARSYLTADFGYTSSAIGDLVWQDNNGDGLWQTNEPGIANVLMELYLDENNDGIADGAAIATATTDSSGRYSFQGLAPNNYLVRVAASNFNPGGVLEGATQTGDPDASGQPCSGTECDNTYWAKGTTAPDSTFFPGLQLGQKDMSADFGYKPATRVLGDALWLDSDGDGVWDAGEPGLADVTIKLCSDAFCSTVLQTTTTDENGNYSFAGLANNTIYYVKVDTTDPDFPAGLTPTYDLDGTGTPDGAAVNTGTADRFDVDFGYRFAGSNSITGTAWHDDDSGGQSGGIGDIDAGESIRYADVPVYLWRCVNGCGGSDDILVAQTFTNSSGQYSFGDLADGSYRVVLDKNAYSVKGLSMTTSSAYSNVAVSGGSTAQRDFGFLSAMDFGDLPASYGTLLRDNGARHTVPTSGAVYLGNLPTTEGDARVGLNASDDVDEGVSIAGKWSNGAGGAQINVIAGGCSGSCYLSAWVDWNGDGDFNDAQERVLVDRAVTNGSQLVTFDVPNGTFGSTDRTFYVRFRLYPTSTNGTAQPTGLVTNGEVEDYRWTFHPNAVKLVALTARTPLSPLLLLGAFLVLGLGVYRWRRRR